MCRSESYAADRSAINGPADAATFAEVGVSNVEVARDQKTSLFTATVVLPALMTPIRSTYASLTRHSGCEVAWEGLDER